jgi:hypothetical protein
MCGNFIYLYCSTDHATENDVYVHTEITNTSVEYIPCCGNAEHKTLW